MLALALTLASAAPTRAAIQSPAELQRLEDRGVQRIIVGREPGVSSSARADSRTDAGVDHVANMRLRDTEVVRAKPGKLVEALRALEAEPGVRYAEPDVEVHATTNDPFWASMWGLQNVGQNNGTPGADIDAAGAWALSTGAGQTVAVVDTGATFSHPDLQGAYATNPGETGTDAQGRDKATNRMDDDHDGYVDDSRGWDFTDSTDTATCPRPCEDDAKLGPDSDPSDGDTRPHGHGTHVMGTIAARRDNAIGVAGVAPDARVFPLRALGIGGSGNVWWIAAAFDLAGAAGYRIVNASLGGPASPTVEAAIVAHPETLYVVAAGNDAKNDDIPAAADYPCAFPEPNIVCVGATDHNDALATFSNYGATTVDLFAPGVDIVSTFPFPSGYATAQGTSMATPHVAGTLALMLAENPALTAAQLKAALLGSVDPVSALRSLSVSGGRLNAAAAVAAVGPAAASPAMPSAAAAPLPTPSVATPTPAPAPSVVPAPVLGPVTATTGALTARRPVALRFVLDRAATARITVRRRSGRSYRDVTTVTVQAKAGVNRYVLRTRIGTRTLRRGRYRIVVQAVLGTRQSAARTLGVTVR